MLTLHPAQHLPRSDTAGVCLGEEDNGWIMQVNWNELIGYDTVVARDNGEAFDTRRFTIGHTGLPFVQDKAGTEVEVVDFPAPGQATTLIWSTATQHFEVVGTHDIGHDHHHEEETRSDPIGYYEGHPVYRDRESTSCSEDEESLHYDTVLRGWFCEDVEEDEPIEPIEINGYLIYPEPKMVPCEGFWNTVSASRVEDGVLVHVSGWFCDNSEAEEEEARIANSCQHEPWAAWCTVSQTCTQEIHGEDTTFPHSWHGHDNYSCFRVKTVCLGESDDHLYSAFMHNGHQVFPTGACFSHATWTNTYFDVIGGCGAFGTDYMDSS